MQTLFENVLTASLYGSVIIAALVLARPLLKKLPKKYLCLLWLLAFARLLMPFEIPFDLSLQPDVTAITQPHAVIQPTIPDLPEPVPALVPVPPLPPLVPPLPLFPPIFPPFAPAVPLLVPPVVPLLASPLVSPAGPLPRSMVSLGWVAWVVGVVPWVVGVVGISSSPLVAITGISS